MKKGYMFIFAVIALSSLAPCTALAAEAGPTRAEEAETTDWQLKEKEAMSAAIGKNLDEHYDEFRTAHGMQASYIDHWYNNLKRERRKGVILTVIGSAVVGVGVAIIGVGAISIAADGGEEYIGLAFASLAVVGIGGPIALGTLIPGIIHLVRSKRRLARMSHLRSEEGRHFPVPPKAPALSWGLGSLRVRF